MVGKRTWANGEAVNNSPSKPPKPVRSKTVGEPRKGDKPKLFQYSDASTTSLEEQRREDMKNRLLSASETEWEKVRMSDEDVRHCDDSRTSANDKQLKGIKNKKIRQFYEEQNQRLNDWLEVDALVIALADDILDHLIRTRIMTVF